MKSYETVYKIENGKLVKNTENKLEYTDENGNRRVKTNPSVDDFAKVGKFVLSGEAKEAIERGKNVDFIVRNDKIYPIDCEVEK